MDSSYVVRQCGSILVQNSLSLFLGLGLWLGLGLDLVLSSQMNFAMIATLPRTCLGNSILPILKGRDRKNWGNDSTVEMKMLPTIKDATDCLRIPTVRRRVTRTQRHLSAVIPTLVAVSLKSLQEFRRFNCRYIAGRSSCGLLPAEASHFLRYVTHTLQKRVTKT